MLVVVLVRVVEVNDWDFTDATEEEEEEVVVVKVFVCLVQEGEDEKVGQVLGKV